MFSGSGDRYPTHVGGYLALEESGWIPERLIGVSGGAIVAAAIACGYSGDELVELILETLPGPSGLIDLSFWPFTRYGLVKGDRLLEKFREVFPPTFADVKTPLTVLASNFTKNRLEVFSTELTPEMDLPLAIRASISIPFVFRYVRHGGDVLVDGGMISNIPVDLYSDGEVVAFRIKGERETLDASSVVSYLSGMLSMFLTALDREHKEDAPHARILELSAPGSGIGFDMSEEEACELICSAKEQTRRIVESWR